MAYKVKGIITDYNGNPLSDLYVEVYDKDIINDDLIGITKTDNNGMFELTFEEDRFKKRFEFLEQGPDLYLIIKDDYGTLYRSDVRSNASKDEEFFIKIEQKYDDPYADSFLRIINAFSSLGGTIDNSKIDIQRVIPQMLRLVSSWAFYTREDVMHSIGYPGPQVPRYPKKIEHKHTLPWNVRE